MEANSQVQVLGKAHPLNLIGALGEHEGQSQL